MKGHSSSINSLYPLTENTFISGSEDKCIRLWDIIEGITVRKFMDHSNSVV